MDDLERRTAELDQHEQELTVAVGRLGDLPERMARTEWVRKHVVRALVVLAVVLVAIGVIAFRADHTAREQEHIRTDVLCPVFALTAGSYDPDSRPPGPARDRYIATIEAIRKGYDDLGCTGPLVPPRVSR